MAVKKQEAAQAAQTEEAKTEEAKTKEAKTAAAPEEGTEEQDTVVIRLFKDSHRYSEPVFVGVNGETYLVQRGVPVEVPKAVAEVLQHSEEMENAAMEKITAAEAAAAQPVHRV